MLPLRALLAASSSLIAAANAGAGAAAHVRVNFGADPTRDAVISFAANASAPGAFVAFASGGAPLSCGCSCGAGDATVVAAAAADNGYANAAGLQVVFTASLEGMLLPATTYSYVACLAAGAAAPPAALSFTTLASDAGAAVPRVLYWGDLGRDGGGQAWPFLEAEANKTAARAPDACSLGIQNGDFGYDLADLNGARGAAFMERFSGIASLLPTYTTIGNHELPDDEPLDFNASHYVNMLGRSMPGGTNGSFYSANVGLMHLVFLSSEVLALGPYGGVTAAAQQAWLEADLAAVDRAKTPWVVAVHHRPFYCSNANSWCGPKAWQKNVVRVALEPLYMRFGVDVVLSAHEHSVEYTWPVVDGKATQTDYQRPKAPVHVTAGVAGCNETDGECLNPMGDAAGDWSWVRLAGDPQQYGYSRFWASNASSFHLEQVQVLADPSGPRLWQYAVDIFQDAHGPFSG